MTITDAPRIAADYFRSWKEHDFATLRSLLSDDATFRGPLGSVDGGDACLQGLQGLAEIVTDIVVEHIFVDGDDIVTWYDLHTTEAPPMPTVNWMHVEHGRIAAIRVIFDPRPLLVGAR